VIGNSLPPPSARQAQVVASQPLVGVEHGRLMGHGLSHRNGGPHLALCLAPERARTAAGFDYFSIYTIQHHTELDLDAVTVVNDPRENAEPRERATADQP
jgi:hypothetical protein